MSPPYPTQESFLMLNNNNYFSQALLAVSLQSAEGGTAHICGYSLVNWASLLMANNSPDAAILHCTVYVHAPCTSPESSGLILMLGSSTLTGGRKKWLTPPLSNTDDSNCVWLEWAIQLMSMQSWEQSTCRSKTLRDIVEFWSPVTQFWPTWAATRHN